jgi:hypothetical protein
VIALLEGSSSAPNLSINAELALANGHSSAIAAIAAIGLQQAILAFTLLIRHLLVYLSPVNSQFINPPAAHVPLWPAPTTACTSRAANTN